MDFHELDLKDTKKQSKLIFNQGHIIYTSPTFQDN